jgi:glyoxylase-like metal-dependent hydrolase (beta-lactamase superfamily II)
MVSASEITALRPGLFVWEAYDATVKADLSSSAAATNAGLLIVDPISLADDALDELTANRTFVGVILTNSNHVRASGAFAARFSIPIFAHERAHTTSDLPDVQPVDAFARGAEGVQVIRVDGAAPGEIALHIDADGGSLIVGDALINFGPSGFDLLPAKYRQGAGNLRDSLRQLLELPFQRILFAHGAPIVTQARLRLENLLSSGS